MMHVNQFIGTVPTEFSKLSNLERLFVNPLAARPFSTQSFFIGSEIQQNQLGGPVPRIVARFGTW
jgi:hypothetical protein